MSAANAMQPVAAKGAGQGVGVGRAEAEGGGLPPVHHKACEAERLRALNGMLGAEPQPKGLLVLLEALSGSTMGEVVGGESSQLQTRAKS